ncbi:MAG: AAA family ATPase, partial [Planctomycetales bacterium]|nr:AAA family ATPase [Planctomycetales bacterium]
FLDYTTLAQRKQLCEEELRLDSRFAKDLYVGVVPITMDDQRICVDGEGEPVEYAVKMRRFPDDALLSGQLTANRVQKEHVLQLAAAIADFHQRAAIVEPTAYSLEGVLRDAVDNLCELQPVVADEEHILRNLQTWTRDTFEEHRHVFEGRVENGFIRECHGDLHLGNIVYWGERFIPFDGIEFNESFRWIDVLSDVAFLAMDFAAHQRDTLGHTFLNAYLEHTDDRHALALLRWYEVYRALVRAKVASLRAQQLAAAGEDATTTIADRQQHIDLAHRLSHVPTPCLFITHGVSGSGKTTVSDAIVERLGAIRLRSDIERKRLYGATTSEPLSAQAQDELYSPAASEATYAKLRTDAQEILQAGYSVVLDATFLQHSQRQAALELARRLGVDFSILDCEADESTLRQRVKERLAQGQDASDADVQVLESQLATRQPLSEDERQLVVDLPSPLPRS